MAQEQKNVELLEARKPSRGIYILPNLFTTGCLFGGFYAIMQARSGNFEAACIAIFIAMVMDILDGRLARLTNTESEFGSQYDSLADVISFGLSPALMMYEWSLHTLGKVGGLAAFIYMATAALRLARFNSMRIADKSHFLGLPTPAAAGLTACAIWLGVDNAIDGSQWAVAACILMLLLGMGMVSNINYRSFKDMDLKDKVPFVALIALVLVIGLISLDPPIMFFITGLSYALSGPVMTLVRQFRDGGEG